MSKDKAYPSECLPLSQEMVHKTWDKLYLHIKGGSVSEVHEFLNTHSIEDVMKVLAHRGSNGYTLFLTVALQNSCDILLSFLYLLRDVSWDDKAKIQLLKETDKLGNTLLHLAIIQQMEPVVPIILKILRDAKNYDVLLAVNNFGSTTLHLATYRNNMQITIDIWDRLESINELQKILDLQDHDGNTPLHFIAKKNYGVMLNAIVRVSSDVDLQKRLHTCNNMGNIPLHYSIIFGFDNPMKRIRTDDPMRKIRLKNLLRLHTNISHTLQMQDQDGKTAIHLAIEAKDILALDVITKSIASIDILFALFRIIDKSNYTPLHLAVKHGYSRFVEWIFRIYNTKFPLNFFDLEDSDGNNLLHLIINSTNNHNIYLLTQLIEIIGCKFLLFIERQNKLGDTPLHLAISKDISAFSTILSAANTISYKVSATNHFSCNLLLTQNKDGYCPLHLAIIANKKDAAALILRYADFQASELIDLQDRKGNNALHLVAQYSRHAIFQHILNFFSYKLTSSVLTSKNNKGLTPLNVIHRNASNNSDWHRTANLFLEYHARMIATPTYVDMPKRQSSDAKLASSAFDKVVVGIKEAIAHNPIGPNGARNITYDYYYYRILGRHLKQQLEKDALYLPPPPPSLAPPPLSLHQEPESTSSDDSRVIYSSSKRPSISKNPDGSYVTLVQRLSAPHQHFW